MNNFKRGDIVRQQVTGGGFDYFHVEQAHANGALDVLSDRTGKPFGLSAHHSGLEKATLAELVAAREVAE